MKSNQITWHLDFTRRRNHKIRGRKSNLKLLFYFDWFLTKTGTNSIQYYPKFVWIAREFDVWIIQLYENFIKIFQKTSTSSIFFHVRNFLNMLSHITILHYVIQFNEFTFNVDGKRWRISHIIVANIKISKKDKLSKNTMLQDIFSKKTSSLNL